MAALVVLKPIRICPRRPLKSRMGKFEHTLNITKLMIYFQLVVILFPFKYYLLKMIYIAWITVAFGMGFLWKRWGLSFSSGVIWSLVLSPVGGFVLGII